MWLTYVVAPTIVCSPRYLAGPSNAEQEPIRIWLSVTPGVLAACVSPRQGTSIAASKKEILPTCNFIIFSIELHTWAFGLLCLLLPGESRTKRQSKAYGASILPTTFVLVVVFHDKLKWVVTECCAPTYAIC